MSNARLVILFLGVFSLIDVTLMGLLALNEIAIPDPMANLAFATVTGLAAILAKTSTDSPPVTTGGPTTVNVDGGEHKA